MKQNIRKLQIEQKNTEGGFSLRLTFLRMTSPYFFYDQQIGFHNLTRAAEHDKYQSLNKMLAKSITAWNDMPYSYVCFLHIKDN